MYILAILLLKNRLFKNIFSTYKTRLIYMFMLLKITYITHSFPMLPFSTPCKHQKTVRVEKGCIWSKWINEISKLNKFFAVDSYAFVGLIIHSTSEIRFSSSVKNAEVIV